MNGTSMAAPHVTGALGIALSGLRAQGLAWSPFSVKRAVENTATVLGDMCQFGQGNGLLNIEKVFEHLQANCRNMERDVRFAVSCGSASDKGIHLRGAAAEKSHEIPVKVEPFFLDNDNRAAKDKQGFNLKLVLSCTESWVSHPQYLDLMFTSRHFLVSVDPTGLPPGAHTAYITAHSPAHPAAGKLWEVPITVVRTEPLTLAPSPRLEVSRVFQPGAIARHFVKVPQGATWACFKARNLCKDTAGKFILHTIQLLPSSMVKTMEHYKMFNLAEDGSWEFGLPVRSGPGAVVEFCLAKWWANIGNVHAEYTVTFHGVRPSSGPAPIVMHGGEGIHRLDLDSELKAEEVAPEIKLKSVVQVVRPGDTKVVSVADARDILPNGRQMYELQLTYSFSVAKTAESSVNLSMLSEVLYESQLESQIWMLYDTNKRLVGCGDAYPSKWALKLEKGDYTARVNVRHEKKDVLDKFTDTPMLVSSKLSSPVSLDVYSSHPSAQSGGKKMTMTTLHPGNLLPIFLTPPATEKYCKGASLGQYLQGTATFAKDEVGKKADVYTFKYILPDAGKKKDKSKDKEKKKEDSDAFKEALRDCKITWLAKLGDKALYQELVGEGTNLTGVNIAMLNFLQAAEGEAKSWASVLEQAETTIKCVDQPGLLAWLGVKSDTSENAAEVKKEMEKIKTHLVEALAAKGEAMIELGETDKEKLLGVYSDIVKYTDANDNKVMPFEFEYLYLCKILGIMLFEFSQVFSFASKLFKRLELHGKALKVAVKHHEDKQNKDSDKIVSDILRELGWAHAVR